jgi:hypothetical protein
VKFRTGGLRAVPLVVLLACGGGGGESPIDPVAGAPATITHAGTGELQGPVAGMTTTEPAVVVLDGGGRPVANVPVTFSVTGGGGWVSAATVTTDASGRAATAWYMGPQPGAASITAATGALSISITATAEPLVAGRSYFGANSWVELIPGELPIIVSAPHGGAIEPDNIPTRTGNVTTVTDAFTEELAREIGSVFRSEIGRAPTVVIMRLHRRKIDANREIVEAAQGNAAAERAWREYHGFIEAARAAIVDGQREGFYIDLHGHGHPIARLELGYTLSANDLKQSDQALDAALMVQKSSIRARVAASGTPHSQLLRGPTGLGTLFELHGFPSVPSAAQPHPGDDPYFTGGYNTNRHSSRDGNLISGVQIEANRPGVRDTPENRRRFAAALLNVLRDWHPALFTSAPSGAQPEPIRLPNRRLQTLAH